MRRTSAMVCAALFAACGEGDSPIRIGVAGPLSDAVGEPMRRGAELALAEINAAGGVAGRRLELLLHDDRGDLDSAVAVASSLVGAGVVAVVGHVYSGTTLAAAPVYGEGRRPVPVITPSSSSPQMVDAGAHVFRLCPTDLEHAAALAAWARRELEFTRGAVLYENSAYGRGMRAAFAARFTALGGTLVTADPYLGGDPDVAPYLDRLARDGTAEFLVIAGNRAGAESILRATRERGLDVPVLGGDGLEGIESAGPVAEGVLVTSAYLPAISTPENQAFLNAWRARYPGAALPNQPAAATYDAVHLLAEAMRVGGATRRGVLATLPAFGHDLPPRRGATGSLAWDGAGDLSRAPVRIVSVREGATHLLERR